MSIHPGLSEALSNPLFSSHSPGDQYIMDGKGGWEIAYYPIFEDGQTMEPYDEPRALVSKPKIFNGDRGFDLRETPLRYLKRSKQWNSY